MSGKTDPESKVREIRRKTRRKFSAEEKIRIVLEGDPARCLPGVSLLGQVAL